MPPEAGDAGVACGEGGPLCVSRVWDFFIGDNAIHRGGPRRGRHVDISGDARAAAAAWLPNAAPEDHAAIPESAPHVGRGEKSLHFFRQVRTSNRTKQVKHFLRARSLNRFALSASAAHFATRGIPVGYADSDSRTTAPRSC